MFTLAIQPRVGETDMIGHINNTVLPIWFESARFPLFSIFMPDCAKKEWNLIMVHADYDYLAQIHFPHPVEIRSWVSKIGNTSFTMTHEAWQRGVCSARGKAVLVHFDYARQEKAPIPDVCRAALREHFIETPV